ncbi:MAG: RHS repeat-associated core domain-containing protein [Luteolibacter sp.]
MKFGETADSKMAVSQGRLSWAANRVQDSVGNFYRINYTRDAATSDFDFVNQRVQSIDYTGNDAQGLVPYCHVVFDYATRPDISRSYSKYAGSLNNLRLSKVRVLTGTFLNHFYVLSYETSYQSQRSRLVSLGKEVPGGAADRLRPTLFEYDGLEDGDPIWRDPGVTRLPVYGTGMDATGEVNSIVTVESEDTMVRLSGDVSRAYRLDAGGVNVSPDTVMEFDFRSQKQHAGALIGLDSNKSFDTQVRGNSNSNGLYRIGGDGSTIRMTGNDFNGPTVPYAVANGWEHKSLSIGTVCSAGLYPYLVLMCVDNESSDGYDNAYFSNVRIYRTNHRVPGDDTAIKFAHDTEIPQFSDAGGKDLGVVTADFDSDGLPDLADWRATGYTVSTASGFQPLVAETVGQAYRNVGDDFVLDGSVRPPSFLPLGCRSSDASASAYNKKHHLLAQPMDIDGDGNVDLMGSLDIKRVSGQIKNQYGFYTLVNGVWTEKAGWRLPFSMENTGSSVETGGNRRDEHFQWVDLNSDGYLDLVVHTTSSGRLYDIATGALLTGGNASTAYINKGRNGPGWIRDDSRKIPEPLMEALQDVGRRLVDVDGDGVVDMAESSIYAGSLRSMTYKMNNTSGYRWNSDPGMENPPNNIYDFPVALVKHDSGADQGVLIMDVNGDGMPDLLQSRKVDGAVVPKTWMNQGIRNKAPWQPETAPGATDAAAQRKSYCLSNPLHYETGGVRVAYGYEVSDVNGDGLPDFVYSDAGASTFGDTNNLVFLNTGNGWMKREAWGLPGSRRIFTTAGEREDGKRNARLQDMNGDGFPDLITNILGTTPKVWYNNCRPEVLKSVTDGFGSKLTVNYNRLNDPTPIAGFNSRVYQKGSASIKGQTSIIDSRLVVSSYSEPDGMGGTNTKYQRYGDLRYDRDNEASLGFGWIEAKDELTDKVNHIGQVSHTDTARVYPFGGSPILTTTSIVVTSNDLVQNRLPGVTAGTKILSTETAEYAELPPTVGQGGTIHRPVQTKSVKELRDLSGNVISRTTTLQNEAGLNASGYVKISSPPADSDGFDAFGFVKNSKVIALDGSVVTTKNHYDHYTGSKWYLGRLRDSTVSKSGGGRDPITKTSCFTYASGGSGLLLTETVEPGNAKSVTKTYTHDGFGNVLSTKVSSGGEDRTSTSTFTSDSAYKGRFLTSETNPLGHTVSYVYDPQRALLTSTTDIGGLTTSFVYDGFGTLKLTNHPDGTQTGEAADWATNASIPSNVSSYLYNPFTKLTGRIKFVRAKQSSGTPIGKVYLDSLGRELCTETTILRDANASGSSRYSKVYSITNYDKLGRKARVSDSFAAGETPHFTLIEYDFLNRLVDTALPGNNSDYVAVFRTDNGTTTNPLIYSKTFTRDGKALERWEDQHGRLVKSADPSGQVTTFSYDQEGRMLNVKIGSQTLLTNKFDLFGNKTDVTEANSGHSSSVYDGFGQVTSSTNAKGQVTTFDYDQLGRPITVSKPEGTYHTDYDGAVGNGKGKAWRTTGPDGYLEEIAYDGMGRPIRSRKTQFGETSYTYTSYDALGRVYGETDAGGLGVIHEYDDGINGIPSAAISLKIAPGAAPGIPAGAGTLLWKAGTYDSKGRAIKQTLAQGVTANAAYNAFTGQLESQNATGGTGELLQNKAFIWDPTGSGNLVRRDDWVAKRSETFTYDPQNRVSSATTSLLSGATNTDLPTPETYVYDANGNLRNKGATSLTYGGTRPHAVMAATVKGEQRSYTYDAAGYVTNDSKRDYSWSSFGQLRALDYLAAPAIQNLAGTQIYAAARVQTDFTFDAGGNRAKQLKKRIAANSSREVEETTYLGSYEREIRMTQADGSSTPLVTKITHRHTLGGLGVYTQTISPTGTETKLSTILKDHLGSTDVIYIGKWSTVSNAFITPVIERQSFNAWGERRNADTWQNYRTVSTDAYRTSSTDYDRGYTGHEQLDDSGLIHMNGRIYDPELGRMLSPDPMVQVPEYSQNFNRYSYVMNNPLNMTDPSGFSWISKVFCGFGSTWAKENWKTVVVIVVVALVTYLSFGTLSGAATLWGTAILGTTTAAAVGATATAAVGGAFLGGLAGGLSSALAGGDLGDVLRGAAVGAVQGAITAGLLHEISPEGGNFGDGKYQAGFNAKTAIHIAGHGVVGGASNAAMGGKFQDGFASAAAGAAAADAGADSFGGADNLSVATRTAAAGIIGGTASSLGGGKFANGAYTAAFQHYLNAEAGRTPAPGTVDANEDGGPDPRMENAFTRHLPLGERPFLMVDYWGYFDGSAQKGRYGMVTLFDKSGDIVGSWEFNNGGEPGAVMIKQGTYEVSKHWSLPPSMPTGSCPGTGRYPNSGNGPAYWRDGYSFKLQVTGPSASPGILFHPDGANPGTHGCFGIVSDRVGLYNFHSSVTSRVPLNMYTPEDPSN